jgi:transcriptional regulator with XRE-family HTH domain
MFTPEQVRELRLRLGWSQTQLARYLRLDQSSVCRMESKEKPITGPAAILLEQLARGDAV